MRSILLLFSILSCSAATLEQYLSAPFASEIHAAPGGGKVVWILNERGARNLWVASAPDYKGRRLTSYQDDDGQDIGMIQWSADGKSIVYVRGGDLEHIGRDNPNPRSLATTPEQAIYVVPFDGGAPRKLADGHSPAITHDGRVAFIRNRQIYLTAIDGMDKPVEIVQTKANPNTLRWSPDGSHLAFVSNRGDHALIEVYSTADKSLQYLDPSSDRDESPAWSIDGRRIALSASPASTAPAEPVPCARRSLPGRFASPISRPARAARSGAPIKAPAARSIPWSLPISFTGPMAIVWFFRGKKPAGCIFIPFPPKAVRRNCSRRAILKSSTSL